MNAPSYDIMTILVGDGIGIFAGTSGWSIYIGDMPEKPDTVVVIRDVGGEPLEGISVCPHTIENVNIEVYVRDLTYNAAYVKINEVQETLNKLQTTIGQVQYTRILRTDVPRFFGYDETRRSIWRQNYRIMRQIGSSSSNSSSSDSSSSSSGA